MAVIMLAETLIDGTGRDPIRSAAVVIEDGKITQVGPRNRISFDSTDHQVIDVGAGVLLPGLIDAHCHVLGMKKDHSRPAHLESLVAMIVRGLNSANDWLGQGVTTIRDLGTARNLDLQLRDEIEAGRARGPRIFGSGRPIVMTGGLRAETAEKGIEVNSADEARRAAREQLRAGVDLIKMFSSAGTGGGEGRLIGESGWEQLTVEEMAAAIFEAHKAGRRVAVHAIGTQSIKNTIRAGADSVEHGTYMDEECVALMKEHRKFLVPTLTISETLARHGLEMGYQPHIPERAKIAARCKRESTAMCHEVGVPIAVGTDPVIYDCIADECRNLLRCGLSPMEVIESATRIGAMVIGVEDRLGTLEVGKIADLIVLAGNPLDDIEALKQVQWVIQNGKIVKSLDNSASKSSIMN